MNVVGAYIDAAFVAPHPKSGNPTLCLHVNPGGYRLPLTADLTDPGGGALWAWLRGVYRLAAVDSLRGFPIGVVLSENGFRVLSLHPPDGFPGEPLAFAPEAYP